MSFDLRKGTPNMTTNAVNENSLFAIGFYGKIRYLRPAGCFVLGPPDYYSAVAWPFGSKGITQGDRVGVSIPEYGSIWEGDEINSGGYEVQVSLSQGLEDLDEACTNIDRISALSQPEVGFSPNNLGPAVS